MGHNTFPGNPGENPEQPPEPPTVHNVINGEVHGTVFQVDGETFIPNVDLSNESGPFILQAGNIGGMHLGRDEQSVPTAADQESSPAATPESDEAPHPETFIQANEIGAIHVGDVNVTPPAAPKPETRQPGENPDTTYDGEPAHFELTGDELKEWEREQKAADLEKDWKADRQRAQQEADALAESALAEEIREELVRLGLRPASGGSQQQPQATAPATNRRPAAYGGLVSFHSTVGQPTRNRFRPTGDVQKNTRQVEADEALAPKPRRRWLRKFRKPPTHE